MVPERSRPARLNGRADGGGGAAARGWASALLIVFFPASILWSTVGGAAFYLLALLGMAAALRDPRRALVSLRAMPELCAVVALLIGLNLASLIVFDLRARDFSWVPFLAMPAIALLAHHGMLPARSLHVGASLGAVAALGVALYDGLGHGSPRPTGTLNAIVFGQLALICTLYALSGVVRASGRESRVLYVAGVVAGLAATVASGTRGALLAAPLLAGLLWRGAGGLATAGRAHRRLAIAGALALVVALGAVGQRLALFERFAQIDDEIIAYQEGHVGTKAVALRLALWTAAIDIAAEHPVFGVGAHQFKTAVEALQAEGRYPPEAVVYSHAHNLFLTVLAEYGAIGLAVLAAACVLAWRGLGRAPPAFAHLGRTALAMWCVLGLTNDLFAHQNTLRLLALGLALCAAVRADDADLAPGRQGADPDHRPA